VLTHSLSHALIREISRYSGYPATSIRRKGVYISNDGKYAGIFLYTLLGESPSMGRLISLTSRKEKIENIIRRAIQEAKYCSGDPACSMNRPVPGRGTNIAACHACMFVSETSCELRNL